MTDKADVVFLSGKFRVIHAGHMRLFRTAIDFGQKLVVALDISELSEEEVLWRKGILENIEYVDEVVNFDGDVEGILRSIRPSIVIKGHEFRNAENIETRVLAEYGGKIIFTSGASFYSENDLIGSSDSEFIQKLAPLPQDFMARNGITTGRLIQLIESFSRLRVCVIGDLIIDEYINCHPLGMSQEEPTVVVTPIDSKRFFGGAGIVAAHANSLGASTSLLTVTGQDETSEWALKKAFEYELKCLIVEDPTRPTTLKQRYRSGTQTLLKISHLTQDFLDSEKEKELIAKFSSLAENLDVVIFSDFSYGVLSPYVVEQILATALKNNVFISADSQSSSQIGNLGKFRCVGLISGTEREARMELKDNTSGLAVVAESLRSQLEAKNLLLKMGGDGVLISAINDSGEILATDEISAINKNPIDTSGAGDSMLAGASLALASGANIYEAALVGSVLAGVQVGRLGNTPISQATINSVLQL